MALIALVAVPFLSFVVAAGLWRSNSSTRVDHFVDQPVPFSHKHHVGEDGIDCRYCHTMAEKSAFAGLPPTHTCMTCHSQLYTNAAMLAPVRESLSKNKPLKWHRVNVLPGFVYFDHSVHLAKGIGCTTCHGQVDKMPLMAKSKSLRMQWCLDCHRNPERFLRPKDKLYSVDWKIPADQEARGKILAKKYGVSSKNLTDCSVCHR